MRNLNILHSQWYSLMLAFIRALCPHVPRKLPSPFQANPDPPTIAAAVSFDASLAVGEQAAELMTASRALLNALYFILVCQRMEDFNMAIPTRART